MGDLHPLRGNSGLDSQTIIRHYFVFSELTELQNA